MRRIVFLKVQVLRISIISFCVGGLSFSPTPAQPDTNLFTVCAVGCSYTDVQTAINNVPLPRTADDPWTIRIEPGVYIYDGIIRPVDYISLVGSSREGTVLKIPASAEITSPVIDLTGTTGVRLESLTVLNEAPRTPFPEATAVVATNAKRVVLHNVRLEANGTAFYDFSTFANDDSEDFVTTITSSQLIGHGVDVAVFQRHTIYAYDTLFLADVRTSDPGVSNASVVRTWENVTTWIHGCDLVMKFAQTMTSGGLSLVVLNSTDTVPSFNHVYSSRLLLDVTNGNVVNSFARVAAVALKDADHTADIHGTQVLYKTGSVTSAAAVAGIYVEDFSSTGGDPALRLYGSTIQDLGGSGGTQRKDVVIGVNASPLWQPEEVKQVGSRISSFGYYMINGNASVDHSRFAVTQQSLNYQAGEVMLSQGAATVTLPFPYPSGVQDYKIMLTPFGNESVYVFSRTNTTFTIKSSQTNSSSLVTWVVLR